MNKKGKSLNDRSKILIVLLVLVIVLPLLWLWSVKSLFDDMSDTSYRYEKTSLSPTGEYSVTVWQSQATWSFGSSKVKVEANREDAQQVYETELSDDGGQGSIEIHWEDEQTARITLCGSEQKDEVIRVKFEEEIQITSNKM